MMLPYAKNYYIIYDLWTGIINCKSSDSTETFFSLYHLEVKFMFT